MRTLENLFSRIICLSGMVLLSAVAAISQVTFNPSTTGALLTINGTVSDGTNSTTVNATIYDRDIVADGYQPLVGTGGASTCTTADQVQTAGYVLQAAAPTGCDPGDLFEGTIHDGFATLSSTSGAVAYTFSITTHYQCGPNEGTCNVGTTLTNTNGTITSGDTGFLTVTNNGPTGTYFVGTITLQGTPGRTAAAGSGCTAGQTLTDSLTFTNNSPFSAQSGESSGQSVRLALASDSSGCGGFSISQTGQTFTTSSNLIQNFVFNNATGQHVEFDFDFSTASGNGLNFNYDGATTVTPFITLQGITHDTYKQMVAGTSQASTDCFTAPGLGTDASGNPLCAEITIACTDDKHPNTALGDQCGQSTQRNLLIKQILDVADFSVLPNTAPTLAEGSDTWSPNNCTLVGPEQGFLCPRSELTQLKASGDCSCTGGGTGKTLNSSFVFGNGEPEWNTVPTIPAWSHSTTVPVSFTANPPNPPVPNSNNWVAAPNESITFGEENLGATPADTTFPIAGDQTAPNPTPCPSSWTTAIATPFTTPPGYTVSVAGPGQYEVHFFSTACDDQEELAFPSAVGTSSPSGNLATFKTASFGVDQTPPTVTAPVLSGGIGNNTFAPGSTLTASFSCSDDPSGSGLAVCGTSSVIPASPAATVQTGQPVGTLRAGPMTSNNFSQSVPNYTQVVSGSGRQTLTVYATDLAGNQTSASTQYCAGYNVVSTDNSGLFGFTSPVVNPGTGLLPNINSVSVNQAVPMKLTVTDCNGNPVTNLNLNTAGGTVVLTAAYTNVCSIDQPDNTVSTASAGNSGWQNLGGGSYQYNWQPKPPKGSCLSFNVNLGDGISHMAYFKFK